MNPYAVIAALVAAFMGGWTASGWHGDSLELVATKAAQASAEASMARESSIAQVVEDRLATLKANERTIEREKIKIVDRPVYHAVCLDADGLRLINAAKNGHAPGVIAPTVPSP